MIVDDSREVRSALRSLLDAEGFDVVADTGDSDEAVKLVVSAQPDAVVLDWMFNGEPRGSKAMASLGRSAPQVPVVVCTAYPEAATSEALHLGAARVVTKEIASSAGLGGVLHNVIDESRTPGTPHPDDARVRADGDGRTDARLERTAAMAERERLMGQWSRESAMRSVDE